jgi:hypothetical protein
MRYPPPSAEAIPEIEPTAVIDDGSGGVRRGVRLGRDSARPRCRTIRSGRRRESSRRPTDATMEVPVVVTSYELHGPSGANGDAGHRRWQGHAGRCGPASATRGSRRIGDTSAEDVRGASDFDPQSRIASRRLDHRRGGSRPRPRLRGRALRACSRQHARCPHDGEEQEGRWFPQACRHARPLAYGDPLAAHARQEWLLLRCRSSPLAVSDRHLRTEGPFCTCRRAQRG